MGGRRRFGISGFKSQEKWAGGQEGCVEHCFGFPAEGSPTYPTSDRTVSKENRVLGPRKLKVTVKKLKHKHS